MRAPALGQMKPVVGEREREGREGEREREREREREGREGGRERERAREIVRVREHVGFMHSLEHQSS